MVKKKTGISLKKSGFLVFFAGLLLFGVYILFLKPVSVMAVKVANGTLKESVQGPGLVRARVPVEVSTKITGVVTSLLADQGDEVKKGRLIATLDDADSLAKVSSGKKAMAIAENDLETARANLEKAKADLALAESNYKRDLEVFKAGYIAPSAMDATKAAFQAAQSNAKAAETVISSRTSAAEKAREDLRYAEAMLSYTKIYALTDGIITQRDREVGDTVSPGVSIFEMVDPKTLWVVTRIDETVVGRVETGQPALIRLRSGGEFKGSVARIERQSNSVTRELEVDVSFNDVPPRFAIDQEAEVTIFTGEAKGLIVPTAALTSNQKGEQGIMLIKGGKAYFQPVRTGATDGRGTIIIKEGLHGDEMVITEPLVTPGKRVRIKKRRDKWILRQRMSDGILANSSPRS